MRKERIRQLIDLLPDSAPYRNYLNRRIVHISEADDASSQIRNREADLLAHASTDLKFGWRYVKSFAQTDGELPEAVTEKWLRRAWHYERYQEFDMPIRWAMALEHPAMRYARNLIQALLIVPAMSINKIAHLADLSVDCIVAFEQLFFNVRDRLADKAFVASVVWPDGIKSELSEGYLLKDDLGSVMLRAAHRGGLDDVLYVAKMGTGRCSSYDSSVISRDFEGLLMLNATNLARLGLMNQPEVPGIMHARAILTAQKAGGNEPVATPGADLLARATLGRSMTDELLKLNTDKTWISNIANQLEKDAAEAGVLKKIAS
jgi:hypothetical protein